MVLVVEVVLEVVVVVFVVEEVVELPPELFWIAALIAASYLPLAYACEASQSITPPKDEYWLRV